MCINIVSKCVCVLPSAGWQEELQQAVHPDVLPAFLGGNRTDPDGNPMCKTVVSRSVTVMSSEKRPFHKTLKGHNN